MWYGNVHSFFFHPTSKKKMTETRVMMNDLASFGKSLTFVGAIVGTVVGVGVIGGGIYIAAAAHDLPLWSGIVMIILGIIMILGGWLWYYFSRRNQTVAAAQGAAGVVGMMAGAVRGT
jgi:hypothetical protein